MCRLFGEVGDQGVLHPENGVVAEQFVASDEYVGDKGALPWSRHHEVQMRCAHGGASGGSEHPSDRAIVRNRVGSRGETPKVITPLVIAEQVGSGSNAIVGVLDVIEAVLVGFPYLD